jgi:hypothetical protein
MRAGAKSGAQNRLTAARVSSLGRQRRGRSAGAFIKNSVRLRENVHSISFNTLLRTATAACAHTYIKTHTSRLPGPMQNNENVGNMD